MNFSGKRMGNMSTVKTPRYRVPSCNRQYMDENWPAKTWAFCGVSIRMPILEGGEGGAVISDMSGHLQAGQFGLDADEAVVNALQGQQFLVGAGFDDAP